MSKKLKSHQLQGEYSFEVLISLLRHGEQNKQVLYSGITNSTTTLGKRVNELEEMGLINVDRRNKYNVHLITLTEKGTRVALKIQEIEDILNNT